MSEVGQTEKSGLVTGKSALASITAIVSQVCQVRFNRVGLAVCRPLPIDPEQRTLTDRLAGPCDAIIGSGRLFDHLVG